MSSGMILLIVSIVVPMAMLVAIGISVMRESKRAMKYYNAFTDVFLGMLNDEAKASMKLSNNNLSNLYDGLIKLAAATAEIKQSSSSTEMSILSAMVVDRLNRSALERNRIESRLARLEEIILSKMEAEETIELTEADEIIELTELVEEEPVIIELTKEMEVKPVTTRHWGEVCAPKPPHKPMAKRRWGEARVAAPTKVSDDRKGGSHENNFSFTVYSAAASAKPIKR